MMASESVLLPEPFGPMIAWTDPLSTTRSMPFRIVLPSTLTTRSRISRLDIHALPGGRSRKLRESHAVERFRDAVLQLEPDGPRSAVGLAHAVHDGIALGRADLRLDRSLERAHDVTGRDLPRLARQGVAAARSALAVHQTGLAKRGHQLLEGSLARMRIWGALLASAVVACSGAPAATGAATRGPAALSVTITSSFAFDPPS